MDPDFVTCPFDQSHRMLRLRLQQHIIRCRRNYFGPGMRPCPFNATHLINFHEYTTHVLSCSDGRLIEGHRYRDIDRHGFHGSNRFHFPISQDEDWESSSCTVASVCSIHDACSSGTDDSDDSDDGIENTCQNFEIGEPLQGYFYKKKKTELLESSTSKAENPTEGLQNAAKHEEKSDRTATDEKDDFDEGTDEMRDEDSGAAGGESLHLL